MLLEKPAFSPKLSAAEAEGRVSSLLKKNHWASYDFSGRELYFLPYWFFSYDTYRHDKKTSLLSSGFGALNAFSNEMDDAVASMAKDSGLEREKEIEEGSMKNAVGARLSIGEAREIISVRLASKEGASKEHVIISGLEMLFVPIWLINASVDGREISLRVNATTGDIMNKKAVPRREKGFSELTQEMLRELSTPQGWAEYSGGAVDMISRAFSGAANGALNEPGAHGHGDEQSGAHEWGFNLSGEDMKVLALAIIAIAAVLWAVYLF